LACCILLLLGRGVFGGLGLLVWGLVVHFLLVWGGIGLRIGGKVDHVLVQDDCGLLIAFAAVI